METIKPRKFLMAGHRISPDKDSKVKEEEPGITRDEFVAKKLDRHEKSGTPGAQLFSSFPLLNFSKYVFFPQV
jgi:hypothetical protein